MVDSIVFLVISLTGKVVMENLSNSNSRNTIRIVHETNEEAIRLTIVQVVQIWKFQWKILSQWNRENRKGEISKDFLTESGITNIGDIGRLIISNLIDKFLTQPKDILIKAISTKSDIVAFGDMFRGYCLVFNCL